MVKKPTKKPTKKSSVVIKISKALGLTAAEIAKLKLMFKADLAQVLSTRAGGPPPLPDVNVGGGSAGSGSAPGKRSRKGAKKSSKRK